MACLLNGINLKFQELFFDCESEEDDEYNEILNLFENNIFKNPSNNMSFDKWLGINKIRSHVLPSLNLGLASLIFKYAKNGFPILEIGSGIGYSVSDQLFPTLIRTQKSTKECLNLSSSTIKPIYQMDIQGIYQILRETEYKIPLIFALNVFDTLSTEIREKSLLQISSIQNVGDRLLILQDTNPFLDTTFEKLKEIYPECSAIPYFPEVEKTGKILVLLVPQEIYSEDYSVDELCCLVQKEASQAIKGIVSNTQKFLNMLMKNYDLEVIDFEAFYIEHMKNDLEKTGYKTNIFYHTSFKAGKSKLTIEKDIFYKTAVSVTAFKQWSFGDQFFLDSLDKKGIKFDESYHKAFMNKDDKLFGAEILVIEAIKIV